jgi:hypothetical protein
MKKRFAFTIAAVSALAAMSTGALAQLQERPQIPREWYADVVLRHYGDERPVRYAAGCLRWGTHTRTWYDICRDRRVRAVTVQY